MYYIKNGLGNKWAWLAVLYAVFGVLTVFGTGNATQVNTIVTSIDSALENFSVISAENTGNFNLVLGIIIAALVIIGSTANPDINFKYDKYFSFTVPGDFEMINSSGDVDYFVSPDNSYIVDYRVMVDIDSKEMKSVFKDLKDNKSSLNICNLTSYKIGDVKAYDYMVLNTTEYFKKKGIDAKYSRFVYFDIPRAKNVYCLFVRTNDSSVDLYSPEINEIIETVGY